MNNELLIREMKRIIFNAQFVKDCLDSYDSCPNKSKLPVLETLKKNLAVEFDACCMWLREYFSEDKLSENIDWFNSRYGFNLTLDELRSGKPFYSPIKISDIL